VLNWLGDAILRLVGVPPVDPQSKLISYEELAYIVDESSEGGLLDALRSSSIWRMSSTSSGVSSAR
jgi:CBS domain containing-hemolysin-like protein